MIFTLTPYFIDKKICRFFFRESELIRIKNQSNNTKLFCFDDLGVEPARRFYGKDLNLMGEVLLSRYELYLETKHKVKTHATTNLNAEELEERYGNCVRSRMQELFNLIAFDKGAGDKRK